MKTMLSQTQSKTQANNRLRYLKEKQFKENHKRLNTENKEAQLINRKVKNKINYDNNLNKRYE